VAPKDITVFRLRKFLPDDPAIYQSAGAQIVLLKGVALTAIIQFYQFHAAWQRDVRNIADECQGEGKAVSAAQVKFLARRLRQTLEPGLAALGEMAKQVLSADQFAADSIAAGDNLFPQDHPNAGKPLRERIRLILEKTNDADKTAEAASGSGVGA